MIVHVEVGKGQKQFHLGIMKAVVNENSVVAEIEEMKDRLRLVQWNSLKTCQQEQEHYAEMPRGLRAEAVPQEQVPLSLRLVSRSHLHSEDLS